MDRRTFLGTLAGGLLAAPLAAEAQQDGKVYRIGFFSMFPVGPQNPNWTAFVEGLRNHGYVEGKNLQIERRSSEGQVERLPAIAAELVAIGSLRHRHHCNRSDQGDEGSHGDGPYRVRRRGGPRGIGTGHQPCSARRKRHRTGEHRVGSVHREAVPSHQGGAANGLPRRDPDESIESDARDDTASGTGGRGSIERQTPARRGPQCRRPGERLRGREARACGSGSRVRRSVDLYPSSPHCRTGAEASTADHALLPGGGGGRRTPRSSGRTGFCSFGMGEPTWTGS